MQTPGRLFIDLLPIVRRDYKFDNYTLKLVSTFFLDEFKQKGREKHKQEMKKFNQKRNQKLRAIFERFQKIRYQPVIYSGKHYDYTSYNQHFQAAPSR